MKLRANYGSWEEVRWNELENWRGDNEELEEYK